MVCVLKVIAALKNLAVIERALGTEKRDIVITGDVINAEDAMSS